MTRIVIYDEELHEALTVVEIPASLMRAIEEGFHPRRLVLPVYPELDVGVITKPPLEQETLRIVHLRLEPVMRGREPKPIFWYAYADDPELALQLRCAFLPGQIGEVQRRERQAFWRGVFADLG